MRPELNITYREITKNPASGKSVEGYEADGLVVLEDSVIGRMAIVRKLTQYVNSPADAMLVPLDLGVSQLTEMTDRLGQHFMEVNGKVVESMSHLSQGGTELKVQTIDRLHSHVYIEDGAGKSILRLYQLRKSDQYCYYDPVGLAASEVIGLMAGTFLSEKHLSGCLFNNENQFPLGINIRFRQSVPDLLKGDVAWQVINYLQSAYYELYGNIEKNIVTPDGLVNKPSRLKVCENLIRNFGLSDHSKKLIQFCLSNLTKLSEMVDKNLKFVQGPALTWIIYGSSSETFINISPKLLSRGNASDALGFWVEPNGETNNEDLSIQLDFYRQLIKLIDPSLNPQPGKLLL